jgi:hypothetical protein
LKSWPCATAPRWPSSLCGLEILSFPSCIQQIIIANVSFAKFRSDSIRPHIVIALDSRAFWSLFFPLPFLRNSARITQLGLPPTQFVSHVMPPSATFLSSLILPVLPCSVPFPDS